MPTMNYYLNFIYQDIIIVVSVPNFINAFQEGINLKIIWIPSVGNTIFSRHHAEDISTTDAKKIFQSKNAILGERLAAPSVVGEDTESMEIEVDRIDC